MYDPVALSVTDASQVGEARRAAAACAKRLGLSATDASNFSIVVTEAASNLHKHARDGSLLIGAGEAGVEMLALDRGPGMADLGQCLRDGFSTAGSPGTGLGAIMRLSTVADMYTSPAGTAVLARL